MCICTPYSLEFIHLLLLHFDRLFSLVSYGALIGISCTPPFLSIYLYRSLLLFLCHTHTHTHTRLGQFYLHPLLPREWTRKMCVVTRNQFIHRPRYLTSKNIAQMSAFLRTRINDHTRIHAYYMYYTTSSCVRIEFALDPSSLRFDIQYFWIIRFILFQIRRELFGKLHVCNRITSLCRNIIYTFFPRDKIFVVCITLLLDTNELHCVACRGLKIDSA